MPKRKKLNQDEELICDIYDEQYMEELLEGDEISPEEEAFMLGYNDA